MWEHVQDLIERLPSGQRAVIILRDMEEREPEEICQLLSISAENQRVLLHRARARLRQAIDELTAGTKPAISGVAVKPTGRRRGAAPLGFVMQSVPAMIRASGRFAEGWNGALPRLLRRLDRIAWSVCGLFEPMPTARIIGR